MQVILLRSESPLFTKIVSEYARSFGVSQDESSNALQDWLGQPGAEVLLFQDGMEYKGFAKVVIEQECFPDEDLPEICLRVQCLQAISPAVDENRSACLNQLKIWGHQQKASLIEMEVPSENQHENSFLQAHGFELFGEGKNNGYRAFL